LVASPLRTAADIRSYLLSNWRTILPDLLVPLVKVAPSRLDPSLVQVDLAEGEGPVRRLLFVPVASGEPRLIRGLLPRLRELRHDPDTWSGLLVPHMGATGLNLCREAGVGFVDCSGNVYMRFNRVVVQIEGNRNKFSVPKRLRTLFHDKATIPLRILLERPGEWVTTREIAEEGGLSLGWVSQILQQLDAQGYVDRKRGGGTRLMHPDRLLSDWLQQYTFEQNEVYPFRVRGESVMNAIEHLRNLEPPRSGRYALTLQAALSTFSSLEDEPAQLHLYLPDLLVSSDDALNEWADELDLRPAGLGANCFLIKPTYENATFFGAHDHNDLRLVSNLQLYLDLYHYPAAGKSHAQAAVAERLPFSIA
jgi:hypothetical protein